MTKMVKMPILGYGPSSPLLPVWGDGAEWVPRTRAQLINLQPSRDPQSLASLIQSVASQPTDWPHTACTCIPQLKKLQCRVTVWILD